MKFEKEVMQNLAMVTQLGISMLAPIILCVFAGHWLDEHFGFHSVIVLLLFGIAAGVRRIEALTGNGVIEYYKKQEELLYAAAKALKANPSEIVEKIGHLQGEVKALSSENESLKSKLAQGALGDVMNQVVEVKGVKLLAAKVEGVDMNGLRDLGDQLKEKLGEGVVVLAAVNEGKVNLLAMATDSAQKAGAHAGNLIKAVAAIVGGGGGGRPNMAQAGGKNPEKAGEAIEAAAGILEGQIH